MTTLGAKTLGTAGGLRIAQRRLQSLADGLAQIDLEEEVDQAAHMLRNELPSLPDYLTLPEEYKGSYDIATGLQAAATLLLPAVLRANDGLAKLKTPEFEYTFTVPSPAEREAWATEITRAIGHLVAYVRGLAPPRQRQRFSMFAAAGVARVRERREYSEAAILRLYIPNGWLYDGRFGDADAADVGVEVL